MDQLQSDKKKRSESLNRDTQTKHNRIEREAEKPTPLAVFPYCKIKACAFDVAVIASTRIIEISTRSLKSKLRVKNLRDLGKSKQALNAVDHSKQIKSPDSKNKKIGMYLDRVKRAAK